MEELKISPYQGEYRSCPHCGEFAFRCLRTEYDENMEVSRFFYECEDCKYEGVDEIIH